MNGYCIHDDPIIRSMERTGLPPWQAHPVKVHSPIYGGDDGYEDDEDWEEDGDVFFGNESESF